MERQVAELKALATGVRPANRHEINPVSNTTSNGAAKWS
jgi:hypothetical protein